MKEMWKLEIVVEGNRKAVEVLMTSILELSGDIKRLVQLDVLGSAVLPVFNEKEVKDAQES